MNNNNQKIISKIEKYFDNISKTRTRPIWTYDFIIEFCKKCPEVEYHENDTSLKLKTPYITFSFSYYKKYDRVHIFVPKDVYVDSVCMFFKKGQYTLYKAKFLQFIDNAKKEWERTIKNRLNVMRDDMMMIEKFDNESDSVDKIINDIIQESNIFKDIYEEIMDTILLNQRCSYNMIDSKDIDIIKKILLHKKKKIIIDFDAYQLFDLFRYVRHKLDIELKHQFTSIKTYELIRMITLSIISKNIYAKKYEMLNDIPPLTNEIEAKSNEICYCHRLQFYGGKCKRQHGHNGILSIKANLKDGTLSHRPMFISYGLLKSFLKKIDNELDHKDFWAMNENDILTYDNNMKHYSISTPYQDVTYKMNGEGLAIIPAFLNKSQFSTSEITLSNYVIPMFYIFITEQFIYEYKNVDLTELTFFDICEPIKFSFKWFETINTVCTMCIYC